MPEAHGRHCMCRKCCYEMDQELDAHMTEHFNKLSPAEHERLAYLMEECGEVIQVIGKILRHGYESRDPTKAMPAIPSWGAPPRNTSPTNREMLEVEIGDVRRGIAMLTMAGDVSEQRIEDVVAKGPPHKYMHHQGS